MINYLKFKKENKGDALKYPHYWMSGSIFLGFSFVYTLYIQLVVIRR